jgi:hypothetical protein
MSQTNVSVELPKPDTNESKRPDNESSEGATLVPPAETESVPGAWVLCRPVGCFDVICSSEGSTEAALHFHDDRTKPLQRRFEKAYEHIRCAIPPSVPRHMKRFCSITRSRATGREQDRARFTHNESARENNETTREQNESTRERNESAREIIPETDVEPESARQIVAEADVGPDTQQSNSRERDSRDAPHASADLEARVEYLNSVEQQAYEFAKGCRDGETAARTNEKAAEARAKAAEARLAALEAEIYTLRAAQGTPAQGTVPGTSYALQAALARDYLNEVSNDATAAGGHSPLRDAVNPDEVTAAANDRPDAAADMTPLRDALAESNDDRTAAIVAQAGKALIAALTGSVKQHVVRDPAVTHVRPSDIGLVEFSGAHDKLATVIEPEFYPRLLLWLEESENLLRNSGLSVVDQVRVLIANLTGAARKQFLTRWHRRLNFSTMTLADVKSKILALVPNHQTHFSRVAMEMTFRASRLASDLDKFALYAAHGDLPVDGHHFWYRMIQDKLLDAAPDLFRLAAEHFGKRVEFEPTMKFADMIDKFMDIVLAVQTELQTRLVGGKRGRSPTSASTSKPPPKQARVAPRGGKPNDLTDNFTLARKLGLCFGCGELYPKGVDGRPYDRSAHDRGCRKKFVRGIVTDEFAAGISKWRTLYSSGLYSEQDLVELANSKRAPSA